MIIDLNANLVEYAIRLNERQCAQRERELASPPTPLEFALPCFGSIRQEETCSGHRPIAPMTTQEYFALFHRD